jgi:hypothetical protein
MESPDTPQKSKPSRWRENLVALLIALTIIGLLILTAGNSAPFIYGRF